MMKQASFIGAIVTLIFVLIHVASADVPQLISFQGKLHDNAGDLLTGQYEITFRIYNGESGGTHIWTETRSVDCDDGLYHVILGQTSSLNLDFDGQYWLGVQVAGDTELSPRYRLVSAPYAFRAEVADQVTWTGLTDVPAGFADGIDDVGETGGVSQINAGPGIIVEEPVGPTTTVAADFGTGANKVAAGNHNHDEDYINEGQENSVTSGMIVDGTIQEADLSFTPGEDTDWTVNGGNVYRESGNVGIGTDNPDNLYKLHVVNADQLHGAAAIFGHATVLTMPSAGPRYGIRGLTTSDGVGGAGVYGEADETSEGDGVFGKTNAYDGRGVVGQHSGSGNNGLLGSSEYGVYGYSSSNFAGYFDGKSYFSGNVGIGTTSPNYMLDVSGSFRAAGLRIEPHLTSPNLIGGYNGNSVSSGVLGATIGGGGYSLNENIVTDHYGTVGGGIRNRAGDNTGTTDDAKHATVGGGYLNQANGHGSTIAGGYNNTVEKRYTTVGGGISNEATDIQATVGGGGYNEATVEAATVGGGQENIAAAMWATIGGGQGNEVTARFGTIAGGGESNYGDSATRNRVTDEYGTISGGGNNQAGNNTGSTYDANYATVGGGMNNTASYEYATISGGSINLASGLGSTIGGGSDNDATNNYATVCGGQDNTASGYAATVCGGQHNTASGSYSFAAGERAKANHHGTFVWADIGDLAFTSTGNNQFLIRATGGVGIGTNDPERLLHLAGTNPRILIEATSSNPEINFQNSGDPSTSVWSMYKHETTGDFRFYQNGDRMTIQKNTGNVGIGMTSPSYKLDVNGIIRGDNVSPSDIRLKKEVATIKNSLEKISSLRGVNFKWRDEQRSDCLQMGIIAQEVENVFPEAVSIDDEGYKSVAYGRLVAPMIEAIKELKAENETLKQRIEDLETKLQE